MSGPYGSAWTPPRQRPDDGLPADTRSDREADEVARLQGHLRVAHSIHTDLNDLERLRFRHRTVHAQPYPYIGAEK